MGKKEEKESFKKMEKRKTLDKRGVLSLLGGLHGKRVRRVKPSRGGMNKVKD